MPTYLLKTSRTGLRLLQAEDILLLEPLEKDADVRHFLDGPVNKSKTQKMIKKFMRNYQRLGLPCFLVFDLETGGFIGRAGFGMTLSKEIEVGYVFHKQLWRQGFATEILHSLLKWAQENISAAYIIAYAAQENIGSWRAMEKCGMTHYKTENVKGLICKFYKIANSY